MKKITLILFLIITLCSVASVQGAPFECENNIIEYWTFNESSGNVIGQCGIENLTPSGAGISYSETGRIGNSILNPFPGNHITATSDTPEFSFNGTGTDQPFSLSFWVDVYNQFNAEGHIYMSKDDLLGGSDREYNIAFLRETSELGTIRFTIWDDSAGKRLSREITSAIDRNGFYFITAVYDGSRNINGLDIYLNGVLSDNNTAYDDAGFVGMEDTPGYFSASSLGGYTVSEGNGYMDEGIVWGTNLTASDVSNLYQCGLNNISTLDCNVTGGGADITPPTWNETPKNLSIFNTTSINVDTNATDETAIDTYYLSDTTYLSIDSNGIITNSTILPVGNHTTIVNVNDTSNNNANFTFQVTINQFIGLNISPQIPIIELNSSNQGLAIDTEENFKNTSLLFLLAFVLTFAILYNKNKFIMSLFFMALSFIMFAYASNNSIRIIGLIIFFTSFIGAIYEYKGKK